MNIKIYKSVKHMDNRGWLSEIIKESLTKEPIKQVYISLSHKGSVRGGHFHKRKVEWFSVISGKAKIVLEDLNSKEKKVLILSDENIILIEVRPFVYHTVESLSDKMLLFVAVNEEYDKNDKDTYR